LLVLAKVPGLEELHLSKVNVTGVGFAAAHGKGDHLTAHELSKKARELSEDAHRHSAQLAEEEAAKK